MEAAAEFMQSVLVGLVVVVVGVRAEGVVMEATGETVVVMASLVLGGGDAVSVTDETTVTQLADVTVVEMSVASAVVHKPDDTSDTLAEGDEALVTTEMAPSAGATSTARIPSGSGEVNLAGRFVDVVVTELSLLGAETVCEVLMEGVAIVVELEVTERLRVMDSEEVEVAEAGVGGSAGAVVLVSVEVGSSAGDALASGAEALLSSSVGVVAAAGG